jgi:para-nitrobenzyl esterase
MGPITQNRKHDEQCLHLTVTARTTTSRAPVLVWLHGGAYISGGGDLDCYRPGELARDHGLVVVNVSYRLGVFGYHPGPVANLGLLDQTAALRWIRSNISVFGGDPDNVTLVGQSAGADAIVCLLASDEPPLFHRAILMSPPLRDVEERSSSSSSSSSNQTSPTQVDDLRGKPVSELLAVQKELLSNPTNPAQLMAFAPSLGSVPLPDTRAEFDRRVAERIKPVPVLIGWTAHDGRPFSRMLGPLRKWYGWSAWLEPVDTWYVTRSYFQWPSQKFHRQVLRQGGTSTTYSFDWYPTTSPSRANHCIDIPFVLGGWEVWKEAPMLVDKKDARLEQEVEEQVRRLGRQLKELWAEFARGRPLKSDHIYIGGDFELSPEQFT